MTFHEKNSRTIARNTTMLLSTALFLATLPIFPAHAQDTSVAPPVILDGETTIPNPPVVTESDYNHAKGTADYGVTVGAYLLTDQGTLSFLGGDETTPTDNSWSITFRAPLSADQNVALYMATVADQQNSILITVQPVNELPLPVPEIDTAHPDVFSGTFLNLDTSMALDPSDMAVDVYRNHGSRLASGSINDDGTSWTATPDDTVAVGTQIWARVSETNGGVPVDDSNMSDRVQVASTACGKVDITDLSEQQGYPLVNGTGSERSSGYASNAGDLNDDGIDDVLIGTAAVTVPGKDGSPTTGAVYVAFGSTGKNTDQIDLSKPEVGKLVRITNSVDLGEDSTGDQADSGGDFDGDGIDDFIVSTSAFIYLVYGSKTLDDADLLDLDLMNSSQRLLLSGNGGYPYFSSMIGDVNGDGLADILIGTQAASPTAHVVYGQRGRQKSEIQLSSLSPTEGFAIQAPQSQETIYGLAAGRGRGDINGDGIDDILVLALYGDSLWVVYGSEATRPAILDLNTLGTSDGYKIQNTTSVRFTAIGDVNGDSLADVSYLSGADKPSSSAGVIYGQRGTKTPDLNLDNTDLFKSELGFYISPLPFNMSGEMSQISAGGDINGDKIGDIVFFEGHDQNNNINHVIYGRAGKRQSNVDLENLSDTEGYTIINNVTKETVTVGTSNDNRGDVNGDGLADILLAIGPAVGTSYVIYGCQ